MNFNKLKYTLTVASLVFAVSFASAQQSSGRVKKGIKYYNKYSYAKAISILEPLKEKNTDVKRKLADSYKYTGDTKKSEEYFAQVVQSAEKTPNDLYNYAQVLENNGKYAEADAAMKNFISAAPNDHRAKEYNETKGIVYKLQKDEGKFALKNLAMNSAAQEFGPSYYKNQVVYASTFDAKAHGAFRQYNWNGKPFLNMYLGDKGADMELSNTKMFDKKDNKKYHEGPVAFNPEGTFMVLSRDNYKAKAADKTTMLELCSAELKDGKWTALQVLPFCSKDYSCSHATLTSDGKLMYFASDMPGGVGGVDIWKVTRNTDGSWGKPENLGDVVNTEGNEEFPFIHQDGSLFFASNGHPGLGGLDNFIALPSNGGFKKVINLGAPLNTNMDDFGLIVDKDMKTGYVSSNRAGGKGDDDIYSVNILKPLKFGKIIKGQAKDKEGNLMPGAMVKLTDSKGNAIGEVAAGKNGEYEFAIENDDNYKLNGKQDKYFDGNNTAATFNKDEVVADVILEKDPGNALRLLVSDGKTNQPLEGVKVKVTDLKTGAVFIQDATPSSGDLMKPLTGVKMGDALGYKIELVKEGYFPKTVNFNHTIAKPGIINVADVLVGALKMDKEVKDLRDLVVINDIRFDLNKFNIRPDAAAELDKVVEVMNKYPNMVVELGSHTDCRASIKYNETLSDKRAKASAAYIKSKITNPARIYGKGYGESQLLNGCACEGAVKSTCSEEEHQKNRRTEFKIISMGAGADKVDVINNSTNSFDKK